MNSTHLYSLMLEFRSLSRTRLPRTTGHLVHALFLNLLKQFNKELSVHLHDAPGPHAFTLSSLLDAQEQDDYLLVEEGRTYRIRVTLLEGENTLAQLKTHVLESGPVTVRLGTALLQLTRLVATPSSRVPSWVMVTDWPTLISCKPRQSLTLHFQSPTAFSVGNRQFELFPQPVLVWGSLLRVWNTFAPLHLHFDKQQMRALFNDCIFVIDGDLHTEILSFPGYQQKGFVGTCCYFLHGQMADIARLTTLAALAPYAGVGYKTPMGMGQTLVNFADQ